LHETVFGVDMLQLAAYLSVVQDGLKR